MNRGRRLLALVATAVLALSGCGNGDDGDQEAEPTTSMPTTTSSTEPQKAVGELSLQMRARNDSGQDGTATLSGTADGGTRVVLELAKSPSGPQPSHINAGTCDDLGDIAHILGGMRGGRVEATLDASLDSLLAGEFAVSVAKSPQEFGVIVSCAEIART